MSSPVTCGFHSTTTRSRLKQSGYVLSGRDTTLFMPLNAAGYKRSQGNTDMPPSDFYIIPLRFRATASDTASGTQQHPTGPIKNAYPGE
jgi:hypothetical protein